MGIIVGKILTNKKKVALIVLLLFITAAIGLKLFPRKSKAQYQTASVERGTIIESVSLSGQIVSANVIQIVTQASGTVKQVFVKDGDYVNKGDKILEIELDQTGQQKNAQAWSSYLSAKNSFESAQATAFSLQSDMFNKWNIYYNLATNSTYQNPDGSPNETNRILPQFLIAQNDWLAAEAKYKNQQSVIAQAQAALNNAWLSYELSSPIVTAPTAGIVTNLTVVPGMVVSNTSGSAESNQNQRVAVITSEAAPIASFLASEVDVGKIKIDQQATITFDSLPEKTFTGKVQAVDRLGVVNNGVTNYPVIIKLDINSSDILPNMAANANIIINSKNNVLKIPSSAIQHVENQDIVRVLKNGKEQEVVVETGLASDTETEIVSGLSEGDTIIMGAISNSNRTSTSESPFGGRSNQIFMRSGIRLR